MGKKATVIIETFKACSENELHKNRKSTLVAAVMNF